MKTVVLCHFFNEEYLLPFWLNHHAPMFDHGIMINYASTDASVSIITNIVPHWTIVNSRNRLFDAHEVDQEVMEYERSLSDKITIALNVTEFLYLKKPMTEILPQKNLAKCLHVCSAVSVLHPQQPTTLIEFYKMITGLELNPLRYLRVMHSCSDGAYTLGRHSSALTNEVTPDAFVIWMGYYPWNDRTVERKLQIKTRMDDNINSPYGAQHRFGIEKHKEILQNMIESHTFIAHNTAFFETFQRRVDAETKKRPFRFCILGKGCLGRLTELALRSFHESNEQVSCVKDADVVFYYRGFNGREACKCATNDEKQRTITDLVDLQKSLRPNQLLIYSSSAAILEGWMTEDATEDDEVYTELLDEYSTWMFTRENAMKEIPHGARVLALRLGSVVGRAPVQRQRLLVHDAMMETAVETGQVVVHDPDVVRSVLSTSDFMTFIQRLMHRRYYMMSSNRPVHVIYNVRSFSTTLAEAGDAVAKKIPNSVVDYRSSTKKGGFRLSMKKVERELHWKPTATTNDDVVPTAQTPCRCCGSTRMMVVLDMGQQPLANSLSMIDDEEQPTFPLILTRCVQCHHSQQDFTVDPAKLYSQYLYASGTNQTILKYFAWFETYARNACNTVDCPRVLEIACNDGSQLDAFQHAGWSTFGVDPAQNLVQIARGKGHDVEALFWGDSDEVVRRLLIKGPWTAIVAQNVVAHVPDPCSFFQACRRIMNHTTRLFVQVSQGRMFTTGQFDTIYHEHYSFFSLHSMSACCSKCQLKVVSAIETPIHGSSLLCTIVLSTSPVATDDSVRSMMLSEYRAGVCSRELYANFGRIVAETGDWTRQKLQEAVSRGFRVVGYGAAAKGITFLHHYGLKLDYIVDDSPLKIGLRTPCSNIPIVDKSVLASEQAFAIFVVVLAWNFYDEIKERIVEICKQPATIELLAAFPSPRIEVMNTITTDKL